MNWEHHRKWAERVGISKDVSEYIDKVIDLTKKAELPEDYKRSIYRLSKKYAGKKAGKSARTALPIVMANDILTSHDASRRTTTRGRIARDIMLEFLRGKSDDYQRAWHLHHHLDYLDEEKHSARSIEALMADFQEYHPRIFNEEIAAFVISNGDEIFEDLH